ncbi:hypothetical protein GCM10007416_05160 [Kroppenstedtia guangzhouensis]|uniref:Uncharacterized protein n=1 Tax=Kroppenstedtia guangzhouensis TaxID=1274356 RepID=A0ABQ1G109_9BACL|nr:hypothetical protein GCM10007416_05160 [Kroppenstedtia guangzhouensis]
MFCPFQPDWLLIGADGREMGKWTAAPADPPLSPWGLSTEPIASHYTRVYSTPVGEYRVRLDGFGDGDPRPPALKVSAGYLEALT